MTEKVRISNDIYLAEVCNILDEGKDVCITARGNSMLPFIVSDMDKVILRKSPHVKVGDIALARIAEGKYVLHRVLTLGGDGNVVLMGDGNIGGVERCSREDICGIVTHVITPGGKKLDVNAPWRKSAARFWRVLLPLRRYILAIYRRTFLKLYR